MATLYENFFANDNTFNVFEGSEWRAQTFTPSISHKIGSASIYCYTPFATITTTVSIRATNGAGKPTGSDLASKTLTETSIGASAAWVEFVFSSSYSLVAGTKYAIVVRTDDGAESLYWDITDLTLDEYTGGAPQASGNSGSTWVSTPSGEDFSFREYDSSYPTDPLTRVKSINRMFDSGRGNPSYTMELLTGGSDSVYFTPISSRSLVSTVPLNEQRHPSLAELTPEQAGFTMSNYLEWVQKMTPWHLFAAYGHIPTFGEWMQMQIENIKAGIQ